MRKLIIALQVRLLRAWLMDERPRGHPVELLLWHGHYALGRLANAMRPR